MLREAKEESGLDVKILRPGPLIEYLDRYGRAVAVPFLIESRSGTITLTEHSESRWIPPGEASRYRIVPDLRKALALFDLG